MKTILAVFILLVAATVQAQAHSVSLWWGASPDSTAAAPGTANVYRALAGCSPLPTFVKIFSGAPAAGPYIDTNVGIGVFCYYVTAVISGAESLPSNTWQGTILPSTAVKLGGVAQ